MSESGEHINGNRESVVFKGKIGEVVHTEQEDGRVFEQFRRPPGTRLIIVSPDNRILITKEFRQETNGYDLRLPGGKVCDTLEEYDSIRGNKETVRKAAVEGATREAREEVGLDIVNPEPVTVAKSGATVDWDLHYFLVRDYHERPDGQELEHGEDIEVNWMQPSEIRQAITDGQMQEWRSVGVLLGIVLPQLEQQ
jgi:8-oxo-dGTP pyrophosphatase MutT (NUDIX family)